MQDPLAITGNEPVGEIPAPTFPPIVVSSQGGRLGVQLAGRDVTGAVESITAMFTAGDPPRVHFEFRDDVAAEYVAFAAEGAITTAGSISQLVREYLAELDLADLETRVAERDGGLGSSIVAEVVATILEGLPDD